MRNAATFAATFAALVLLAGCAGESAPEEPAQLTLFDGTSTAGWSQAGPGGFRLVDGALESHGGMGLLWYSDRTFRDFVLDLDWRATAATDNSGVFLRFPAPGDDPWVAVNRGYEVQINDNPAGDPQKTGAIYNFQPPQPSASGAARPVGAWNHYRIEARGPEYRVWLNEVLVNSFTSTDPGRGDEGHIGLQNHDANSAVQFREIRLKLL